MANWECPHCGNALANGVAVCGACGKEVKGGGVKKVEMALPPQDQKGPGRKKLYAILAVLLVVLGSVALLLFAGVLQNPLNSTAAIVNGEKITVAEVDKKLDLYKKATGKSGQADSDPAGKVAAGDLRKQILNKIIRDKILVTEAAKEKITVSPQEIAAKISAVKKSLKLSDKDFDAFLKSRDVTPAAFENRIEKDILFAKLVAKGTQEKGMTRAAWVDELNKRAKVEIVAK
ncbi:MAG: SurA N-terminal domain-containing protein [Syntrophales bacterium]|jgi:parvulin-like peptidyl-prolyl isomerase|nr:SurA N-terminal domain-containing protein [Syntrophales bacterium]